jgi:two-component system phosphate regulon sensor histidine kinase PhoR
MVTGRWTIPTVSVGAPDARTRSVWLTQLVLALSVVIINVLVLALEPELFSRWTYATGSVMIVAGTVATLAVPWASFPPSAVLAVPFVDAVAIGLLAGDTELLLAYLWVFPVMWVGMHFTVVPLAALLTAIGMMLLIDSSFRSGPDATLRVFVVLLSLTFIGITSRLALMRSRSLRRLLGRQAERLTATARRRSEQERRTTEILNGVDTGIARLSADGNVLAVNDAYARLYALDPRDPLLPPRSVEYTRLRGIPVPPSGRPFARAARGETFTDASVWLYTPDGEWHALSVTAKRLEGEGDEDATILLLVHDVTAATLAQREREHVTAMASHELKHPLTVMIGNAELALESDELTPRLRERFESIVNASERMLEMTNSMLAVSRRGFTTADIVEDIDLRPIISDSVSSFRATATTHEVAVDVRMDGPLQVAADGFRLRQVIDNVVSNAIKYTPPQGRVDITGRSEGESVIVTVRDTGIGIAAEDLPHIMTPYFRTADAKEKASGTGLGLGITNQIVTAHGGTLTLDSQAGAGTIVTLRFPKAGHAVYERGSELP